MSIALLIAACPAASSPVPAGGDADPGGSAAETGAEADTTPTVTPTAEAEETQPQDEATPVPPPEITVEAGSAGALEPSERNAMFDGPPEMVIDPEKFYYATIKTERGDIVAQLFAARTPVTVNNFVYLARQGFYNNTSFHRVLEGFMAQAGDPTGTGSGGPGYQFQDEIVPGLVFDRSGLLAMANAGPGTNGSQFFITFGPTAWLDGRHTIFGAVIEGQEVLDRITLRDPQQAPEGEGDTIYTIEIEERESSELPTPTPLPPTPTPFPPSSIAPEDLGDSARPLADLSLEERSNYFNSPPEMVIDTGQTYTATIVTSRGELLVRLYDDEAPMAVNNFVLLSALGFYDGTPVNEVVPEQIVIVGAPANVPTSSAGYLLDVEMGIEVEWGEGAIAYYPVPDPQTGALRSNSSQLLMTLVSFPAEVTDQNAFFGQIVEGVDILKQLSKEDTIESIQITVDDGS